MQSDTRLSADEIRRKLEATFDTRLKAERSAHATEVASMIAELVSLLPVRCAVSSLISLYTIG